MLKSMRDSFHQLKWILFAVIAVFILSFVYLSGSGGAGQDGSARFIARVDGSEISAFDFDKQYRARLENYREQYRGQLTPEMLRYLDLPHQVLDAMINRRLQLEQARRLKLRVSDDEIAAAVTSMSAFQDKTSGKFIGAQKYQQLLQQYGYTADRFEEEMREDLLANKYAEYVRASILVPDTDIAREFSARNDKATIEYVLIPASRLESGVQPTDAELKAYYEKHRERYRKPEQRRIKYLIVDRAKVRARVTPAESALRAEYEAGKKSFEVPEQVTAAHILIRVDPAGGPEAENAAREKAEKLASQAKAGGDFAKLAKENSEDPSSKENGGQLPPFGRGQMMPEFDQAVFALSPGQTTGPVKTQYGYHVIKLVSKSPARTQTFEEVRPRLASSVAERQTEAEASRIARELSERVRKLSRPSDEDLRKLADNQSTFFETTQWIARGEPVPGIGANTQFSDEAFGLKLGKLSKELIPTARGPAILKPTEERPAGVPPFEELRSRVAEDWKSERREKEALEKLQPAAAELSAGTTLVQIAARYDAEVKTTPEFSPGGPIPEIGNAPELSTAVFATPQGQAGKPVPVSSGFVLFRVLTKQTGDIKALESQRSDLVETIRAREGEKLLRSSLQQLRSEKRVEVNEDLLKSFTPEGEKRS